MHTLSLQFYSHHKKKQWIFLKKTTCDRIGRNRTGKTSVETGVSSLIVIVVMLFVEIMFTMTFKILVFLQFRKTAQQFDFFPKFCCLKYKFYWSHHMYRNADYGLIFFLHLICLHLQAQDESQSNKSLTI